jgi:hypothetical protein
MENTIKENFYLKQDLENHQILEEKNNKTPSTEIPVEIMIEESELNNSEPTE